MQRLTTFSAAVALAISASAATATTYTSEAAFTAASSTTLEDFETFAGPLNTFAPTEVLPGFTATESGGANFIGVGDGFPSFAVSSGSNALGYDDNGGSVATFDGFASALTAFGFNITTTSNSVVNIVSGAFNESINLLAGVSTFFGITTANTFSSISVTVSGGPNVGFDDVRYGSALTGPSPVPLPATGLLLAGALGGFGVMRKRRKLA